jgi:XTP/dITP diphosphohydrolase
VSNRLLLLATGNAGKVRELSALLAAAGWTAVTAAERGITPPRVLETGRSYLENAVAKAVAYANAGRLPALADDSGLEVDALGGAPGVDSAFYGGPGVADDRERNAKLLRALAGVPRGRRGARFRSVIAVAWPGGEAITREGVLEGRIAEGPRGENGFGYDPVFELPDGRTLAEIGEEKQALSHRGRALRAMIEALDRR